MSAAFVYMPPPICANNAARLAPNPNPTSAGISFKATRNRNNATKLIPGTARPITAPPKKPVLRVAPGERVAALAVLTLALTATFMPTYPANRERRTPHTKANEVVQLKRKRMIKANQGMTRMIVPNCLLM
jgi:hypothetical protein